MYNTEILAGQTTYINGEKVTITDTSDAFCVIVTDVDGNQMSVRKSTLMSTPLFNFNEKQIDNNKKRIADYQAKATEYKKLHQAALNNQKGFLTQISQLFEKAGTKLTSMLNNEQKAIYDGLKKDYWGARADAVSASNREYSCLISAFDAAHDNAMISSQYV